jgi:hypothetical protein
VFLVASALVFHTFAKSLQQCGKVEIDAFLSFARCLADGVKHDHASQGSLCLALLLLRLDTRVSPARFVLV